ncbi:hypothetical protein HanRHA438_Chr17g0814501 [Helianthus annuus]|nr:hypothetical protein HanRHA438_Chr17g0814501 [Helianthus annuus]
MCKTVCNATIGLPPLPSTTSPCGPCAPILSLLFHMYHPLLSPLPLTSNPMGTPLCKGFPLQPLSVTSLCRCLSYPPPLPHLNERPPFSSVVCGLMISIAFVNGSDKVYLLVYKYESY